MLDVKANYVRILYRYGYIWNTLRIRWDRDGTNYAF